jgi:hypothetical protein
LGGTARAISPPSGALESAVGEFDKGVGNTSAVGQVRLAAVGHVPFLDVLRSLADLAGGVVEQRLLLCRIHLPEQVARLLPVIVIHAVIPVRGGAGDLERRPITLRSVNRIDPNSSFDWILCRSTTGLPRIAGRLRPCLNRLIFLFSFANNERDNIEPDEKKTLHKLAELWMAKRDAEVNDLVKKQVLLEIQCDD